MYDTCIMYIELRWSLLHTYIHRHTHTHTHTDQYNVLGVRFIDVSTPCIITLFTDVIYV